MRVRVDVDNQRSPPPPHIHMHTYACIMNNLLDVIPTYLVLLEEALRVVGHLPRVVPDPELPLRLFWLGWVASFCGVYVCR